MEHYHDHRHKKIRGKVVLSLVATFLLLPLTESRSLRGGCEFSSKEQTRNMTRGDQEDLLTFTLLHVNDIHSHFEEVNVNLGTCKVRLSNRFQPLNLPSVYLEEPTDIYFKEHT